MNVAISGSRELPEILNFPEAIPLAPEVLEEIAPADEIMNPHPSPMAIFEEERKRQHLGEQKLVVAKAQETNNWLSPFNRFFTWVSETIFGKPETITSEISPENRQKILDLTAEIKKAFKAMESTLDPEDLAAFDDLMILIQKKREAEHKRNVILQGEALKKAHVDLKFAQDQVKKKGQEILDTLSHKNWFSKVEHLITPIAAMIVGLGPFPITGNPAIDVIAKPLIAILGALGAANILFGEQLGEHVTTIIDVLLAVPVAATGAFGIVMVVAKILASLEKARIDYALNSHQGDMGVLDHKKRLGLEKFNDLGGKASKATSDYHKELGALSKLLSENSSVIQW